MKRRRWRVRNRQNSTSINHLLITQLSSLSLEITQLSTFFLSLSSVSLLPNTKFPSFLVPTHSLFVGAQISCVLTGHLSICNYYFIYLYFFFYIYVLALRYGGKGSGIHVEEHDWFNPNGIFLNLSGACSLWFGNS